MKWILLIVFLIPAFFSLIRPGFFWMQDDLQAFRIHQMDKCIKDFQIPCRWVPDPGYQYGYPQFNYYPPSVYYLGEVFHLIGFQFIDAVKVLFILGFILAALTMFIFLRSIFIIKELETPQFIGERKLIFLKSLFGNFPSFVGAIIYTYAPYKAVDVYVRGALSEFWAFVFFPLIFWSIYQLIKTEKLKYLAWMALSVGLLLVTHALMSMVFLPLAAIWGIVWIVVEKKWKVLPKVVFGGVLGIGLAAFFVLPMSVEKQYSHSESMLGGYFDYRQHFIDIEQIFISNHWGYGSSYLGPGDDLALTTGHVLWLGALLAVILALVFWKKEKKLAITILVLGVTDLFVLFLTHQKSTFIWEKISLLVWLQFPWRILADSVFLLSTLSAAALFLLKKTKFFLPLGLVMVMAVFILYGSFFKPYKWFDISDKDKFSGQLWEKQLTISIFDYLPIYAKLPPIQKAPEFPEVMDGKANFLSYKKGSHYQIGEVEVLEKANLRLPLFDFPGMKVSVNGKQVSHNHNDCRDQEFCLGLISFDLPVGKHKFKAELTDTPIRTLGNILSLISIAAVTLIFLRHRKNA